MSVKMSTHLYLVRGNEYVELHLHFPYTRYFGHLLVAKYEYNTFTNGPSDSYGNNILNEFVTMNQENESKLQFWL
jgi:hypothetical protein